MDGECGNDGEVAGWTANAGIAGKSCGMDGGATDIAVSVGVTVNGGTTMPWVS